MRAIRRLSKLPPSGVSLEQLMNAYRPPVPDIPAQHRNLPTPPLSRTSSNSSSTSPIRYNNLNSRAQSSSNDPLFPRHRATNSSSSLNLHQYPISPARTPPPTLPLPPIPASSVLPNIFSQMNKRQKPGSVPPSPQTDKKMTQAQHMARTSVSSTGSAHMRERSGSSISGSHGLRTFVLPERRIAPTF
jgi:hypothetical protein